MSYNDQSKRLTVKEKDKEHQAIRVLRSATASIASAATNRSLHLRCYYLIVEDTVTDGVCTESDSIAVKFGCSISCFCKASILGSAYDKRAVHAYMLFCWSTLLSFRLNPTIARQLARGKPRLNLKILKMASAQAVETSVTCTNNSPSQDSNHPDDLFQSRKLSQVPNFKLKACGSRSFSYIAPHRWNQLPNARHHRLRHPT